MKKNLPGLLKGLICLASININVSGHAQNTSSITSNEIVVSVTGIAYEDPALSLLKESLKNNKKVKSTKNSFDKETAKITLSCPGTATDLWDEVPKTTKDFFKLTSIDDKHIALQYKNASQSNVVPNTNTSAASNTINKDDDCKNCYFN